MLVSIRDDHGIQPPVGTSEDYRVRQHFRDLAQLAARRHLIGRVTHQVRAQRAEAAE